MPNLKKPKGLFLKKGIWNKLCTSCKRYIVRNNITKDVVIFLCFKCRYLLSGKRKKKLNCKPYKIMAICVGCLHQFKAKTFGKIYCGDCRPNHQGDKN